MNLGMRVRSTVYTFAGSRALMCSTVPTNTLSSVHTDPNLGAPLFPTEADVQIIGERSLGFLTLPDTGNFCLFRPESYANIKFLPFIFWCLYNEVGKAHNWFVFVVGGGVVFNFYWSVVDVQCCCSFQVYSKVNQVYIHTYPLIF